MMSMLLEAGLKPQSSPELVNGAVRLRPIRPGDFQQWTALREESKAHLTAWEPVWKPSEMTLPAFRRRVRAYWRDMRRGTALPFLVFNINENVLVGGVTLSNIRFGASRSAMIGYWIGAPYARKGYGRAALGAVLDHAFRDMKLNRLEAACQPDNAASIRLLETAGFEREGKARNYLRINGVWRDHLLYAAVAGDHAG